MVFTVYSKLGNRSKAEFEASGSFLGNSTSPALPSLQACEETITFLQQSHPACIGIENDTSQPSGSVAEFVGNRKGMAA